MVLTPCQSMDEAFTRVWNRKNNTHAQYVLDRNAKNSKTDFTVAELNAYDYFEPEWNCEDEVRLGSDIVSSGEVPKFVCGSDVLASMEVCIVYSIGINHDFSFDEHAVGQRHRPGHLVVVDWKTLVICVSGMEVTYK